MDNAVTFSLRPGAGIDIARGQVLAFRSDGRLDLCCRAGVIWLSADGRDIVLAAGQRYAIGPRTRVVLEAMDGGARVALHPAAGAPAAAPTSCGSGIRTRLAPSAS